MSGSKGMRFWCMFFVVIFVTGCTHDIHPIVKEQGLYITKVKAEKAQIVAGQDFQRLTLQDIPLRSSNWKGQKFNVALGKTLTDGVYSYVRSTFDETRIGDSKDLDDSGVTVTLSDASLELWIDDDSSFMSQMLFAPTYYMNTVDAQAKVTLSGSLQLPGTTIRYIRIVGQGKKNLKPASMDAEVIEEVTALAAADASKQIVELMRGLNTAKLNE